MRRVVCAGLIPGLLLFAAAPAVSIETCEDATQLGVTSVFEASGNLWVGGAGDVTMGASPSHNAIIRSVVISTNNFMTDYVEVGLIRKKGWAKPKVIMKSSEASIPSPHQLGAEVTLGAHRPGVASVDPFDQQQRWVWRALIDTSFTGLTEEMLFSSGLLTTQIERENTCDGGLDRWTDLSRREGPNEYSAWTARGFFSSTDSAYKCATDDVGDPQEWHTATIADLNAVPCPDAALPDFDQGG